MTTTTSLPIDPTKLPGGPDSVDVTAHHLSITERWNNGSHHNIHLLGDTEVGLILRRGMDRGLFPAIEDQAPVRAIPIGQGGTLVIALDVDDDHDEVHYEGQSDAEELVGQAIDALVACRSALIRVRKS